MGLSPYFRSFLYLYNIMFIQCTYQVQNPIFPPLSSIFNLMGTLYEHNIVIFPCFNLICDCILYMVINRYTHVARIWGKSGTGRSQNSFREITGKVRTMPGGSRIIIISVAWWAKKSPIAWFQYTFVHVIGLFSHCNDCNDHCNDKVDTIIFMPYLMY